MRGLTPNTAVLAAIILTAVACAQIRPGYYDRGDYAGTFTFQSGNGNPICNGAKLHVQGRY